MSTIGNAFADTYAVDGVIIKVDLSGVDTRQHFIGKMRDELRTLTPHLDDKQFTKGFKPQVYYMDRDRYRAIVKVNLYGPVAQVADKLPAGMIAQVNEVHFKSYAVFYMGTDSEDLRKALFEADEQGQQLNLFGAKEQRHADKGDGKGWRIGDRNSDYHFVGYRRAGQRLGVEIRVKDRPVKRMAAEAVEMSAEYGLNDHSAWRLFFTKLAKVGGDRFDADLTRKSVDLNQYVRGFTDERYISEAEFHCRLLDSEGDIAMYHRYGDDIPANSVH